MNSENSKVDGAQSNTFKPSRNVLFLPLGLSITGLALILFPYINHTAASIETIFLGWGFIILGLVGLLSSLLTGKRYQLTITDQVLYYSANQQSDIKNEIAVEKIRNIKIQQSAIGRFLGYANLILRYDDAELFLQDIERPDDLKNSLPQIKEQSQD